MCVIFHFTWNQRGSHQNFSFLTSPRSLPCRALCQVLPGRRTCVPARYFSRGGNGCEPTDPRLYSFSVGTSDRKLINVKWWLGKERQSTQKRGEGRSVNLWPWPREPQASEAAAGDSGAMPVSLPESSSCWLPSSPPPAERGLSPKGRVTGSALIWGNHLEHLIYVDSSLVHYCN